MSVLEAALAGAGLGLADLGTAEAAGVVVTGDGGCEFRHPLLSSAVLHRTPLADRLAAYRALAAVTPGPTRASPTMSDYGVSRSPR